MAMPRKVSPQLAQEGHKQYSITFSAIYVHFPPSLIWVLSSKLWNSNPMMEFTYIYIYFLYFLSFHEIPWYEFHFHVAISPALSWSAPRNRRETAAKRAALRPSCSIPPRNPQGWDQTGGQEICIQYIKKNIYIIIIMIIIITIIIIIIII